MKELRPISLDEVEHLVATNSPKIKAAAQQVDQSKSLLLAAISAWYPTLSLSANGLPQYLESNTYNENLLRSSYEHQNSNKKNNPPGFLEDYSFLIDALLEIYQVTGEKIWLEKALTQTEKMINNFWDESQNSFFDTSKFSNTLILRPSVLQDNVVPSGSSVAWRILIKLFSITNDKKYKLIVD